MKAAIGKTATDTFELLMSKQNSEMELVLKGMADDLFVRSVNQKTPVQDEDIFKAITSNDIEAHVFWQASELKFEIFCVDYKLALVITDEDTEEEYKYQIAQLDHKLATVPASESEDEKAFHNFQLDRLFILQTLVKWKAFQINYRKHLGAANTNVMPVFRIDKHV